MVHHAGIMAAAREGWRQRSHMAEAAAVTVRRALRLLQLHRTASQATTKIAGQLLSWGYCTEAAAANARRGGVARCAAKRRNRLGGAEVVLPGERDVGALVPFFWSCGLGATVVPHYAEVAPATQ